MSNRKELELIEEKYYQELTELVFDTLSIAANIKATKAKATKAREQSVKLRVIHESKRIIHESKIAIKEGFILIRSIVLVGILVVLLPLLIHGLKILIEIIAMTIGLLISIAYLGFAIYVIVSILPGFVSLFESIKQQTIYFHPNLLKLFFNIVGDSFKNGKLINKKQLNLQ